MPTNVGVVIKADGGNEFANSMKKAAESAKQAKQSLKELESEYKGNANSLAALTAKQEQLEKAQSAYARALDSAKAGQKAAVKNYKECGKALEQLEKELEEAKKAQADLEKAGDTSSKAYKSQVKEVERLEKAVEKQATEYDKASVNISKWDSKVNKAEADVRKSSKAVDQNAKYIDEAKQSADQCATSIDRFGKEMKEAGNDAQDAAEQTKSFGDKIKDGFALGAGALGAKALSEVGKKAAEAAKYVVEVGSNFEASMDKVAALSGASGSALDALTEKAKELGASTMFSASEVADAFGYMALAGWDTKSMLDGIDGVLNLAAASGMDLADASDIVTDQLSAFGLEASDAAKFVDEMAYAQANSNSTTTQLAEAFSNCAANMHAAGQDVETTTSFLEAFANQGIKGSEAGTKLSAIMRDITAKMKDGKIQIGDTAVAVTDANGNFRDMTDIMTDVEAATRGMGSAERSAALSATFTSRSIGGLNMILTEGMDAISGYEQDLRKADGTAANMAGTMQSNLKGAVTELNSATEGLGVALYEKVQGPLTSAVETATKLISGITDALTPERTELENFVKAIRDSNTEINGLLDAADKEVSTAEAKVAELEGYKSVIIDLQNVINSGGELDAFQLYQMQNAIEAVKDEVPGIAENFDAVTGQIDLSTQAIENMFTAAEQGAMSMAYQKAMSQELEAVAQARINQAKATAAVKQATEDLTAAQEKNKESKANGEGWGYGKFYTEVLDAQSALDEANEALAESDKIAAEAEESYNLLKIASEELTEEQGKLADEMSGNATTTEGARKEQLELNKAQRETASSASAAAAALDDEAESTEDAAKAAKDAAKTQYDYSKQVQQAHEEAAQAISKAYDDAKSQIEQAFQINPFDAWEQNEENGITKFQESLDSQLAGLTNYQENLQTVSDHVGKEITPEFLQYIQDMGTGGAQLMEELARAFESGDTERISTLMSTYIKAMDKQDQIASVMAANQVAMQIGAGKLGSTEIEWTGLDNAVSYLQEIGGEISEETMAAFQQAEETAKEIGVKIPSGLVEGIESGDSDPEGAIRHATDLINAAIEGQGTELLAVAREVGINVPDGIAAAIAEGGDGATDAMASLLSQILSAASEAEGEAEAAAESVSDSFASGIESASGTAEQAGTELGSGASTGAGSKTSEMSSAGSQAGSQFTSGVRSQSSYAWAAGSELAQAARGGAASVGGFSSIGYNLAAGVASGINSGRSSVVNAAVNMVSAAATAAKNAAGIRSPSKKWKDQIGAQLGKGVALGIKQSTKDTTEAATAQMNNTLAALQLWVANNKKKIGGTGAQLTENITYAWQKLADIELKNKFGISSKKTENKKTVNKTAKEFNDDVYKAAQTYINNVKALYDISDKDQLDYWKKVRSSLKRGTQAWYDATETIRQLQKTVNEQAKQAAAEARAAILSNAETRVSELKEANKLSVLEEYQYWQKIRDQLKKGSAEWKAATQYIRDCKRQIGTFSVAENVLSNYQTYYDMSLRAEMQYWDEVRHQYTAGTSARIEADANYFAAAEKYKEKLKDIEDDYADKIAETNKKYADAVKARKDQIMGAYDLFDYFESSSASGKELLFNIQTQAAGYEEWSKSIDELAAKGILSDDLMQQLMDKGPNSIAAIKALLTLTTDELKAYQKAYDQKEAAAQKQAEKENKDLKDEVAKEIKDLSAARSKDLEDVKKGISDDLLKLASNIRNYAEDQTSALVAAFTASGAKSAISVGSAVNSNVKKAAGLHLNDEATKKAKAAYDSKVSKAESAVNSAQKSYDAAKKSTEAAKKALTTATNALSAAQKTLKTVNANKKSTKADKTAAQKAVDTATTNKTKKKTAYDKALAAEKQALATLKAKQKALEELQKKGYRSGSRRLSSSGMVWMDEDLASVGAEMLIRKSDNAILTRADPGDTIIPANLANNLFKWGAINPDTLNAASMTALNNRLMEGYRLSYRASEKQNAQLEQMLSLMEAFMPYLADRMTAPIISRDAASVMSGDISREMGARLRRVRR